MKAQPLLFLGDRRRTALLARVAASARRWRQSWVAQAPDDFEASCDAPERGGFTARIASVATSAWTLEVGGDRVAMLLLPHATFAWCLHESGSAPLDGAMPVTAGSLADTLEREVARTLFMETCAVDGREVADVSRGSLDELAEWSRAARAWSLSVKAAGGRGFTLLIAAARVDALAPARATCSPQALERRREAVGENTVTLRALVGETRIPVAELAGLALDDVLLLDQPLAEPVALVCGDPAAPVAAGNLGRAGARRAIKITSHSAPRN
jgi:flagellar motor switch/type III secretory pathway protein FliN